MKTEIASLNRDSRRENRDYVFSSFRGLHKTIVSDKTVDNYLTLGLKLYKVVKVELLIIVILNRQRIVTVQSSSPLKCWWLSILEMMAI